MCDPLDPTFGYERGFAQGVAVAGGGADEREGATQIESQTPRSLARGSQSCRTSGRAGSPAARPADTARQVRTRRSPRAQQHVLSLSTSMMPPSVTALRVSRLPPADGTDGGHPSRRDSGDLASGEYDFDRDQPFRCLRKVALSSVSAATGDCLSKWCREQSRRAGLRDV